MLRTQISLTEAERRLLDEVSATTGRSLSRLIRDAVDAMYGDGRTVDSDLDTMRHAFGTWTDRGMDGAEWVEQLRSGRRLDEVAS